MLKQWHMYKAKVNFSDFFVINIVGINTELDLKNHSIAGV